MANPCSSTDLTTIYTRFSIQLQENIASVAGSHPLGNTFAKKIIMDNEELKRDFNTLFINRDAVSKLTGSLQNIDLWNLFLEQPGFDKVKFFHTHYCNLICSKSPLLKRLLESMTNDEKAQLTMPPLTNDQLCAVARQLVKDIKQIKLLIQHLPENTLKQIFNAEFNDPFDQFPYSFLYFVSDNEPIIQLTHRFYSEFSLRAFFYDYLITFYIFLKVDFQKYSSYLSFEERHSKTFRCLLANCLNNHDFLYKLLRYFFEKVTFTSKEHAQSYLIEVAFDYLNILQMQDIFQLLNKKTPQEFYFHYIYEQALLRPDLLVYLDKSHWAPMFKKAVESKNKKMAQHLQPVPLAVTEFKALLKELWGQRIPSLKYVQAMLNSLQKNERKKLVLEIIEEALQNFDFSKRVSFTDYEPEEIEWIKYALYASEGCEYLIEFLKSPKLFEGLVHYSKYRGNRVWLSIIVEDPFFDPIKLLGDYPQLYRKAGIFTELCNSVSTSKKGEILNGTDGGRTTMIRLLENCELPAMGIDYLFQHISDEEVRALVIHPQLFNAAKNHSALTKLILPFLTDMERITFISALSDGPAVYEIITTNPAHYAPAVNKEVLLTVLKIAIVDRDHAVIEHLPLQQLKKEDFEFINEFLNDAEKNERKFFDENRSTFVAVLSTLSLVLRCLPTEEQNSIANNVKARIVNVFRKHNVGKYAIIEYFPEAEKISIFKSIDDYISIYNVAKKNPKLYAPHIPPRYLRGVLRFAASKNKGEILEHAPLDSLDQSSLLNLIEKILAHKDLSYVVVMRLLSFITDQKQFEEYEWQVMSYYLSKNSSSYVTPWMSEKLSGPRAVEYLEKFKNSPNYCTLLFDAAPEKIQRDIQTLLTNTKERADRLKLLAFAKPEEIVDLVNSMTDQERASHREEFLETLIPQVYSQAVLPLQNSEEVSTTLLKDIADFMTQLTELRIVCLPDSLKKSLVDFLPYMPSSRLAVTIPLLKSERIVPVL